VAAPEEALMSAEQAVAWATLDSNGNRTIHTPAGVLGCDNEPRSSLPSALQLTAAAVTVDLLDAFVHVSRRIGLTWRDVEVHVAVERADRPCLITQIYYQVRVGTDDTALVDIASHELEETATGLASLAGVARRSGHVVAAQEETAHPSAPSIQRDLGGA
jgi:hypothetical protein